MFEPSFDLAYDLTVPELLRKAVLSKPEKEVVYDGYDRLTYIQLEEQSNCLAYSLEQFGIKKGDTIAVCLPNWHEFLVIYFAIAKVGAIIVPFNTRYRTEEVEYILRDSGAKLAFITREFSGVNHYEQFTNALDKIDTLQNIVTVRFEEDGLLSYRQWIAAGSDKKPPKVFIDRAQDVFAFIYTSGSTGTPKGAMLTHQNVVHTGTITAECLQCTDEDVFLVAVPFFHVFGMVPSILTSIAAESRMVLMDAYKPLEALRLIQEEKVTVHHGVPTMFVLELNHPEINSFDLSSLRTGLIAGAPCPVEIVKRIRTEMGCNICIAYGLTETSPTLTMTSFDDNDELRSQTVGRPLPGAEVKIVDDNRNEVPIGETGELACRSFGVMKGYFNMPELTAQAIDKDGWFYTGDLATIDDNQYVRIVGRIKEMIIRGGYKIYPREIEEVFYKHPNVMEAAVVGLPDTVLGEISCAVICLKPGTTAAIEEMLDYIKSKMADYKVPDKILFRDQLPMTASGKIYKIELKEILKEELKAELR